MNLAHYQLKHIADYVNSQNICYTDIRHELTDHIASAIEHKMVTDNSSFANAFSLTIDQVNCSAIQKKKLINETLALWKKVGRNSLKPFEGYRLLMFIAAVSLTALGFLLSNNVEILDKWFSTGINVLVMIPVISCLFDRKFKPYQQSYFMTSVVGLYLFVQILVSVKTFLLDRLLVPSTLVQAVYFSLVLFVILLGFELINHAYKKVRQYAIK